MSGAAAPAVLERMLLTIALAFVVASAAAPPRDPVDSALGGRVAAARGFAPGAVYPATAGLPPGIVGYGSWLGGDASTGRLVTSWYAARPRIALYVAGYPCGPGTSLSIELDRGGVVEPVHVCPDAPGERWRRVTVALPAATRFRVAAADVATGARGWLAVSLPMSATVESAARLAAIARALGCAAFVLCAIYVPGLLLARRAALFADPSFTYIPGFLVLACGGISTWLAPDRVPARTVEAVLACAALAVALVAGRSRPLLLQFNGPARRALAMSALIFAIAVGRALYAPGPPGELYAGTISRTFEPGDRSDSRINYHIMQLSMLHDSPWGARASAYFAPWTFSDRGPLAGLAAVPVVALAGGTPAAGMPEQPWEPFDAHGFQAYRIAMFGFASFVLTAFFGLLRRAFDGSTATFGACIAALAPFTVHETCFTWPKLAAAAFAFSAASLLLVRRPSAAGGALGAAYLLHPSTLFALPALGAAASARAGGLRPAWRSLAVAALGLALTMLVWRVLNGSHYSQTGFLQYVELTGGQPATVAGWCASRAESLLNTLVPFWLLLVNAGDPNVNRLDGHSSVFAHLDFSYWSTLPFALGLSYAWRFGPRLAHAARAYPRTFAGVVALPFALFALFWGKAPTGLMREGLHWWFFVLIGFVAAAAMRGPDRARIAAADRPWIVARVAEVVLLTVGFVALDRGALTSVGDPVTDLVGLAILVAAALGLAWVAADGLRIVAAPSDAAPLQTGRSMRPALADTPSSSRA